MSLSAFFARCSKTTIVLLALGLVSFLGVLDAYTGPEIATSVFFLLPVWLVTRYVGRRAGIVFSVLGAATWFASNGFQAPGSLTVTQLSPAVLAWNVSVRLAFFLIVTHLLSRLVESIERERQLSRKDFLTGAENARSFYELAGDELERARRYSRPLTLAYFDVDNFKTVNDTRGHRTGDELLKACVATMQANVRNIDIVARLGGDEFAILLPETDRSGTEVVLTRVRQALDEMATANAWPISFSIGSLTYEALPESLDQLIQGADRLMYDVKHNGKNSIRYAVMSEAGLSSQPAGAPQGV